MKNAGAASIQQPLGAAEHPKPRRRAAAARGGAEAPERDHVDGGVLVGLGRREQIGMHRHFRGGADQREPLDARGRARGGFERDQGAHAVADQARPLDPSRAHQRKGPIRQRADVGERRPLGAAVAGQIDSQDVKPARRKGPRQAGPDAAVHAGAVQEDRERLGRPAALPRRRSRVRRGLAR